MQKGRMFEFVWKPQRVLIACVLFVLASIGAGCANQITFSREKKIDFTRVISVPDEAVIYMQNLALMRDRVDFPHGEHLELVLPNRIIHESVQLRSGNRIFKSYNIKKGKYTLIRVRNIRQRLVPGKPLLVEYLTWGMYWSAQYRVDIQNDRQLRVQLGAMIQNHWASLSAMKITLVAGWVGNSLGRKYLSQSLPRGTPPRLAESDTHKMPKMGPPGPMLALVGGFVPLMGLPRRRILRAHPRFRNGRHTGAIHRLSFGHQVRKGHTMRRRVARALSRSWQKQRASRKQYQMEYRAFSNDVVKKYKIRRVDQTAVQLQSNFQKSFASYYTEPATRQKATGYTLYPNIQAELQLNEQSFVQVADITLPIHTYYLWPADQGDYAVVVHKLTNTSKVLLPAGRSWLHRGGIFVGQDVCTWTPKGASTHLTTANDGKISVHKRTILEKGDVQLTVLTIHNLSAKSLDVEVFDRNPGYRRKGTLRFSRNPLTVDQAGPLHQWKLQIAARSRQVLKMRYIPPAPVQPKPAAPRTQPAPTRAAPTTHFSRPS